MVKRRTLLALCGLASSIAVAATCFLGGRGAPVIGVDETIGTIPRVVAIADRESERPTASNEVTRVQCASSRANDGAGIPPLRLVVLERGTRRPLPGAQVATWADPTGEHNTVCWYGHWIGPDYCAFISSHGVTLTADAQGVVELDRRGLDLFVAARSNDLFGMTEIGPEEAGLRELEIAPSHGVDVLVRDSAGRPCAGVGVGLGACRDSESFWTDVTDANGHCRIHDFEAVVEEGCVHAGNAVAIRLDIAAAPAIEQWVDPAHPPSEPIVLVAPATGAVRVRLVDGTGRLLAVDGKLRVSASAGSSGNVRPFASSSDVHVDLRNGYAVVEHVTLSQDLWIDADLSGNGGPSIDIAGPKSPGETIDVDLALDAGAVLIRGRALGMNGTPLADQRLEWSDVFDDGQEIVDAERDTVRTDSDGRFDWTMKRALDYARPNLRRTCCVCQAEPMSIHLEGVLPIELEILSDVLELGDVILAPSDPLVRGRVVDQAGRGVRGVALETVVLTSSHPSRHRAGEFDPGLDSVGAQTVCDRVQSSADGSFAFFGPCLDLRWAVLLRERSGEASRILPFTCRPPSKPMEIVIQAKGCLQGTALVDPDWNSDKFNVDLVLAGEDAAVPNWAAWWMDGDRLRFRIEAVAPARGRVEFRDENSSTSPVWIVEGVDVLPGVDSSPAVLADVDLRGKLPRRESRAQGMSVIDLDIVDQLGRPIPSGIAWVWNQNDRPDPIDWVGGRARIADPNAHCIEVWAPDHCFRVLTQPLESARIVLPPEIELEIALDLPPELKDPSITLRSMIRFATAQGDPMSPHAFDGDSVIRFDRAGKARVLAAASGSYGVEVTLTRRVGPPTEDDDGTRETVITQWFEVRDGGGVQSLTFTPDAEQRAEASKALASSKD